MTIRLSAVSRCKSGRFSCPSARFLCRIFHPLAFSSRFFRNFSCPNPLRKIQRTLARAVPETVNAEQPPLILNVVPHLLDICEIIQSTLTALRKKRIIPPYPFLISRVFQAAALIPQFSSVYCLHYNISLHIQQISVIQIASLQKLSSF